MEVEWGSKFEQKIRKFRPTFKESSGATFCRQPLQADKKTEKSKEKLTRGFRRASQMGQRSFHRVCP